MSYSYPYILACKIADVVQSEPYMETHKEFRRYNLEELSPGIRDLVAQNNN